MERMLSVRLSNCACDGRDTRLERRNRFYCKRLSPDKARTTVEFVIDEDSLPVGSSVDYIDIEAWVIVWMCGNWLQAM